MSGPRAVLVTGAAPTRSPTFWVRGGRAMTGVAFTMDLGWTAL
jgi:hypothetical protein